MAHSTTSYDSSPSSTEYVVAREVPSEPVQLSHPAPPVPDSTPSSSDASGTVVKGIVYPQTVSERIPAAPVVTVESKSVPRQYESVPQPADRAEVMSVVVRKPGLPATPTPLAPETKAAEKPVVSKLTLPAWSEIAALPNVPATPELPPAKPVPPPIVEVAAVKPQEPPVKAPAPLEKPRGAIAELVPLLDDSPPKPKAKVQLEKAKPALAAADKAVKVELSKPAEKAVKAEPVKPAAKAAETKTPTKPEAPPAKLAKTEVASASGDAKGPATKVTHLVAPYETLSAIATKYYGHGGPRSVARILSANKGLDPNKIKAGQELIIPPIEAAPETASHS